MARVVGGTVIVLAKFVLGNVFGCAASAAKVVGCNFWALVQVFTAVGVATSGMVGTGIEISTPTMACTSAARGVGRDTSTNSYALLVLPGVKTFSPYLWKKLRHQSQYPAPLSPYPPLEDDHQCRHIQQSMPIYDQPR